MKLIENSIFVLFFISAFYKAFPMNAFGAWLTGTIKLSPVQFQLYFAFAFIPWCLKPVYGAISDVFPLCGYRRKPYILLGQLIVGTTFLVTAYYVKTKQFAYFIKILDSTFEAFVETMLGVMLAILANRDRVKAGSLQSYSCSLKSLGSLLALFIGIPFYKNDFNPTAIIAWTSVLPFAGALLTLFALKEIHSEGSTAVAETKVSWRVGFENLWHDRHQWKEMLPLVLFLVLSSLLPNSEQTWYQYKFTLYADNIACIQYNSIASSLGRLFACFMYGRYGKSAEQFGWVFAFASLFSACSGIPRVLMTPAFDIFQDRTEICAFGTFDAFLSSFSSQFALLPLLVIATFASPLKNIGIAYSCFLAALDLGAFLSGPISAALVHVLGLKYEGDSIKWDNLWIFIVLTSLSQTLVLGFLPLIRKHMRLHEARMDQVSTPKTVALV